jgi:hypothetical protein
MGDILARQYEGNRAHGYYARAIALGANTPEAFRAETALSALGPATGITEAPAVFAPQAPQVTFHDCADVPR